MKVVIIGTGNAASILSQKIVEAGNEIVQLAGRNIESLKELSKEIKCDYTNNLLEINQFADLYIICVTDGAIREIAGKIRLNGKLIVHTAGTISIDILSECSSNYGVLYPLQTLRKEIKAPDTIPLLVNADGKESLEKLKQFTSNWAGPVIVANDDERLKLHVAAVFANNFTNHLLAVTERFCFYNHLDFNLLLPLIEETFVRQRLAGPSTIQTGPALRKDFQTINMHLDVLTPFPDLLGLYKTFTESILAYYYGK